MSVQQGTTYRNNIMRQFIEVEKRSLVVSFLLAAIVVIPLFSDINSAWRAQKPFNGLLFVQLGVMLLLLGILTYIISSRWASYKRVEVLRQQVMHGEDRILQVVHVPTHVSIPIAVEVKANKRRHWIASLGLVLLILALLNLRILDITTIKATYSFIPLGIYYEVVLLLILVPLTLVVWSKDANQSVFVDEEKISSKYLGKETNIRWGEARFFAVSGNAYGHIVQYELHGEREVVRWWCPLRQKGTLSPRFVPVNSKKDFDEQIRVLNTLIQTRTGLELYDLRDKEIIL